MENINYTRKSLDDDEDRDEYPLNIQGPLLFRITKNEK